MKTPRFKHLLPAALWLMAATTLTAQTTATRRPSATRNAIPSARTNTTGTTTPAARGATTNNAAAANANAAISATEVAQQLAKAERGKGGRPKLKFDNAPAELFLQLWSQVTGRTLLTSPDVPKVTMSLRSNGEENWSDEEYLQAIEQQLQLNGIGLLPVGEHFALVVPFKTIGQQGIETYLEIPAKGRHPEMGQIIRQMITPKHVSAEEAQAAIESFKRPDGFIQYIERTNSLLITDTQENVNRMIEIINFIDRPMPVLEEVQVCPIKFAKAADVKKALEEFVEASREEGTKTTKTAPQVSNSLSQGMQAGSTRRTRSLPGVQRPQDNQPSTPTATAADALVSDADRGMIRGKVQIMADERSNQLIIVTRPSNMQFFERIIKVLDIETAPEIAVEIIRLKYAKADTEESEKGVADLLNELIDNNTNKNNEKDSQVNNQNAAEGVNLTENRTLSTRAKEVQDNLPSTTKSKMGELKKENIKILADKRINAVMVMASPGDLAAIKEIIASMDIPVAQVLIETVVLEVSLGDDLSTGVQWVKRVGSGDRYRDSFGGGGSQSGTPLNLFGTTTTTTTTDGKQTDSVTDLVGTAAGMMSGGARYLATIDKLNLDVLVNLASSDSRAQILTSPILMTQDNKEATIESTELVYLYNGMKYMGSSYSGSDYQPDIKQEEIGLHITVTPRINPDGTVVLGFEEKFQYLGAPKLVPGSGKDGADGSWDSPVTREVSGDVSVKNGQTVIIGGLVTQEKKEEEGGIPVLRHIPFIGRWLFGYTEYTDQRKELLVFLTPYVFYTSEEAQKEAQRRKEYLDAAGVWNKGWSNSDLADMSDEEEMLRREKSKNEYELKQVAARAKRTEAQRAHDKEMKELLKKNIDRDKRELEEDRDTLTDEEIEAREAAIRDEELMHEALLREINLDEEIAE